MRILIDLLHPAHVHVFRAIGQELSERGHEVRYTARDKDVTLELLDRFQIEADVLSSQAQGIVGLAKEMTARTIKLLRICRSWRPNLLLGIMGPSIAPVGRLLGIPAVVMYDTEVASLTNRWVYPLAAAVVTPDCYRGPVRGRHVTYPGYHELAYLHPNRFELDRSALPAFGLDPDEPFSIVRFVSWEASHDLSDRGLSEGDKRQIVEALDEFGRVVISSESALPAELQSRSLTGPIDKIHHALAAARLFVGESATMASEAAVLGTPSFYVAERSRGYIDDLSRRGLVTTYQPQEIRELLKDIASINQVESVPDRITSLLREKVDTAEWIANWCEGYVLSRTSDQAAAPAVPEGDS